MSCYFTFWDKEYYPYGSLMPGRHQSSASYRYGFQGQEKDDEVKGEGNHMDFGARCYDSRLGRFLSNDPKVVEFPWQSPYAYANNNPIRFIDVNGEGPGDPPYYAAATSFIDKNLDYQILPSVVPDINYGLYSAYRSTDGVPSFMIPMKKEFRTVATAYGDNDPITPVVKSSVYVTKIHKVDQKVVIESYDIGNNKDYVKITSFKTSENYNVGNPSESKIEVLKTVKIHELDKAENGTYSIGKEARTILNTVPLPQLPWSSKKSIISPETLEDVKKHNEGADFILSGKSQADHYEESPSSASESKSTNNSKPATRNSSKTRFERSQK
jgi:RHS repeat-associated protein